MLPTHDVHCPHCEGFLYSAVSLEDVLDPDAATMPLVKEDRDGSYLRCPHCHSRVAMTPVVTAGRRAFRLAG
jgi:DNA-directed RNA polymerase subunit RPC12/RpoP